MSFVGVCAVGALDVSAVGVANGATVGVCAVGALDTSPVAPVSPLSPAVGVATVGVL